MVASSVVCLLLLSLGIIELSYAQIPCHQSEAMECLDKVARFARDNLPKRSLVETAEESDGLCEAFNEGIQCWDEYKKRCMTPIQKELEILYTEGVRDLEKQFCSLGSPTREGFLKHAKCYNKALTGDAASQNIQYMLAVIEKFQVTPNNKKATFACCGYSYIYHETLRILEDTCGKEAVNIAEGMVTTAFAQAPDVFCQPYEESVEQCKKVLPKKDTKPTDAIKKNSLYKWLQESFNNPLE